MLIFLLLGQLSHNAVLTEKRDKYGSSNRRTWSEGDIKTNQKLVSCDSLDKHDERQLQCQENDSSSHGEEKQSNSNCGTDSHIVSEDHRNSNDQQCRVNGISSNSKQHLDLAVKVLSNRNGLNSNSNSFRQLNYKRSYSHDSLDKTELGIRNLQMSNENCRKDQTSSQLFDKSHFAHSNETEHLDSDYLGNNGQSDNDQLDDPSDSDELNDRCYDNCNDCGKNRSDDQSYDEDSWKVNAPHLENASENFDVDSTDPER